LNLLFICTANKLRSATAEAVFSAYDGIDAMGAGTDIDAPTTVDSELIEWADEIFVMEPSHKKRITRQFNHVLKDKRLIVLGIPDDYDYMDERLVELLKTRIGKLLGREFE